MHNWYAEKFGVDHKIADQVNREMDQPARKMGPNHRRVRHDAFYAAYLGIKYGTPEATRAALIHIQLDEAARNPNIRRFLKVLDATLD